MNTIFVHPLRGDEIVVAIQEERLSRFKRDRICGAGPSRAVVRR